MLYCLSRLKGTAAKVMVPDIFKIAYKNDTEFFTALNTNFGDPDRQTTARTKLGALRQKNLPFHTYLATFNELAHRTGYDHGTLEHFLVHGASQEIRSQLIAAPAPQGDLEATKQYLQGISNRITVYSNTTSKSNNFNNNQARANTTPAATGPRTTTQGGDAMDLSAVEVQKHLDASGKLKESEKTRRQREGLCLYDGTQSVSTPCPYASKLAQRKSGRVAAINTGESGPKQENEQSSD